MNEIWRGLTVGDKVRVVTWPWELHDLQDDTADLYKWLIDTKGILTIVNVDESGLPEGRIVREVGGHKQIEFLLLNHSGLELVEDQ